MNLRTSSKDFGQVKLMVNNCDEETLFSHAPFENFLDTVNAFVADMAEKDEDDTLGLH